MEAIDDLLPVGADRVPGQGQPRRPRDAADGGVDAEPHRGHVRETGGQRDERPHDGQDAADQDGLLAVPGEPLVGAVDVVLAQPDPAAPAAHHGLAGVLADRPGEVAADNIAGHAGHDHEDQVEMSAGDRPGGDRAAERHDQFGRDRDAGRFGHHEHEHGQIAVGDNEVLHSLAFSVEPSEVLAQGAVQAGLLRRGAPRPRGQCGVYWSLPCDQLLQGGVVFARHVTGAGRTTSQSAAPTALRRASRAAQAPSSPRPQVPGREDDGASITGKRP